MFEAALGNITTIAEESCFTDLTSEIHSKTERATIARRIKTI
jgi:hypothetical protein